MKKNKTKQEYFDIDEFAKHYHVGNTNNASYEHKGKFVETYIPKYKKYFKIGFNTTILNK